MKILKNDLIPVKEQVSEQLWAQVGGSSKE